MSGTMGGGALGLSKELRRRQKGLDHAGAPRTYWKHFDPSIKREPSLMRLRMPVVRSVMRMGPRSCGAFCSPRLKWNEIRFFIGRRRSAPEGDRPVCLASLSASMTAPAANNPVHLLLRTLVTLGVGVCTDTPSASLMPRDFLRRRPYV